MSATALQERRKELDAKREELKKFFDEKRDPATKALRGFEPAEMEEYTKREAELSSMVEAVKAAEVVYLADEENEKALKAAREPNRRFGFPGGDTDEPEKRGEPFQRQVQQVKTIGERLVESEEYKAFVARGGGRLNRSEFIKADMPEFRNMDAAIKATLLTTGLTGYERVPGVVELGQQPLRVADLLAKGETTSPTIRYVQETAFTNAATSVAEGAAKPQATFSLAEVDAPVRKIAVTAKVTDEMFADFMQIRDYVNERLPFMVQQREDIQLLTGDGTGSNLLGILNVSGIQTQARGADDGQDAIYKAAVKVRTVGFFEPDGVVINPTNWTPIFLARASTGQYLYANMAQAGPATLWGLRVVSTTAETLGTALVGAFRLGAQIFYRQGITVDATNSNEDDFLKNLVAIRAEQREALAVYRPLGFCTVTSML